MKNRRMQFLVLGLLLICLVYYPQGAADLLGQTKPAAKHSIGSRGAKLTSTSLDLVFTGPFVFVEKTNGIEVWLADVPDHHPPVAVSSGDYVNIVTLASGSYDFSSGIVPAKSMPIPLIPVSNTSILSFSASNENLPGAPQEHPYLTMTLPIPDAIAPWNADPLQVSSLSTAPPVSASDPRLATTTILRYTLDGQNHLKMTDLKGFVWVPTADQIGGESIVAISVQPNEMENQHIHAQKAFDTVRNMIGLKRTIRFPSTSLYYVRNVPLNKGVLPQELVAVLPGRLPDDVTTKGTHTDCMAPSMLITP